MYSHCCMERSKMLIMVEQTQRIATSNHRLVGVIARGTTAAAVQAF